MSTSTISPQELLELCRKGEPIELIDVRTPREFRELHVAFARNEPLEWLDPQKVAADRACGKALYVICRSGKRGEQACQKFHAAGFTAVVNVAGGTEACERAGLPVARGAKAISLERQVRMAAGILVIAGAVLGYMVHPYWVGLSAFVGAGLVFSGATDTCPMSMLIAKMPWNR